MCARMYGRKDVFRKMNWGREIEPGKTIPFRTKKGTFLGIWGGIPAAGDKVQGHARAESLQEKWLDKGYHVVEIPGIELFSERNTVKKNGEMVRFKIPDDHVIKGIAKVQDLGQGKKIFDVRVITEQSAGPIKSVHHRMPMVRPATYPED